MDCNLCGVLEPWFVICYELCWLVNLLVHDLFMVPAPWMIMMLSLIYIENPTTWLCFYSLRIQEMG